MNDPQSFNLLSCLTDFAVRIDAEDIILQTSELSQAFLDLSASPVGESITFFIQPEDLATFLEAKEKASLIGEKQSFICHLLRQRVLPVWMDCHIFRLQGRDEYVLVAFDASHWKENEAKLTHYATHDLLTGLPSRALLDDRLKMSINTSFREKLGISLLLLDLDGFKKINDSLGHVAGDKLIKEFAKRLQGVIRGETLWPESAGMSSYLSWL